MEALIDHKSILVFCPTKLEAEKNAIAIAKYLKYCIDKGELNRFPQLQQLFPTYKQQNIVEYIRQKTTTTEKDLLNCISYGVAYHHAGLTVEEREEIEFLYRKIGIRVLVRYELNGKIII
jgi:DNA polymerase theta